MSCNHEHDVYVFGARLRYWAALAAVLFVAFIA